MDRLETGTFAEQYPDLRTFTFQYGQIRNKFPGPAQNLLGIIYIPVWIDQKLLFDKSLSNGFSDLHSSMDRLETKRNSSR